MNLVGVEGGDAHDYVRVSVDVLGDTVDNDVGTEVERVLDVGRKESVINNDEDSVTVGGRDDCTDVDKSEGRIAGRLDPDQAGLISDVLCDIDLDLRSEGDTNTVSLCDLSEIAVGTSVHVGDRNDMVTGCEALEDDSGGGAAGGEGEGVSGVLEGGDSSLEVRAVRVGGTRVLILAYRLSDGGLCESGRERDGLNDGASDGVVGRPSVDRKSTETLDRGRRTRRSGDRVVRGGHCWGHDCCWLCSCYVAESEAIGETLEGSFAIEKEPGDKRRDWWGIDFKGSQW